MRVKIDPKRMTSLYCTKAQIITEGAKVDDSKTQIHGKGTLCLAWEIDVAESGNYLVAINVALLGDAVIEFKTDNSSICTDAKATRGYFNDPKMNLERIGFSDCIELGKGTQTIQLEVKCDEFISVSSFELFPEANKAERDAEIAEALERRVDISKYGKKGYGFMFHWTGNSFPRYGDQKEYEQAVEDFDTEMFAEQIAQAGGTFVFLTANHAIRHFPAPLEVWEKYYPGFTTKRDLIEDLYQSLNKRGIDLMLYVNFTAAYLSSPYANDSESKSNIEMESVDLDHYMEVAINIFNGIGNRYGDKVKAYWIDSCYQLDKRFDTVDFKPLYDASKTGYENRAVSFNFWILPVSTPWNDFWSGETFRPINVPNSHVPTYGPAKGQNYQELICLEDNWGHFVKDKPIPDPAYNVEELYDAFAARNKISGMLTINPIVYQDGTMSEKAINLLKELKSKVYD